jgi:hypothetical protein
MENRMGTDHLMNNVPEVDNLLYQSLDIPKLTIAASNLGVWFLDLQTSTFLPSARMKELHGYFGQEEMSFEAVLAQIPKNIG